MEVATKTNSLAYQVLKEKYFPNCEFSQETLGSNPSFMWKSIMSAQSILFAMLEDKRCFMFSSNPRKLLLWPGSMPQSIPGNNNLDKLL